MENAEINNIIKIVGLQYKKSYDDAESLKTLRYGKIMIMTDQVSLKIAVYLKLIFFSLSFQCMFYETCFKIVQVKVIVHQLGRKHCLMALFLCEAHFTLSNLWVTIFLVIIKMF